MKRMLLVLALSAISGYSKSCAEYYMNTLNELVETKNEIIDSAYYKNPNNNIERFTKVYWSSFGVDSVIHSSAIDTSVDKFILKHNINDLTGVGREDYLTRYWSNDTLFGTYIIFHDGDYGDTTQTILTEKSYYDGDEIGYISGDSLIIKNNINSSDSEVVRNSQLNELECFRNGVDDYGYKYTLDINVTITFNGYIVNTIKNGSIIQNYIFNRKDATSSVNKGKVKSITKAPLKLYRLNGVRVQNHL